MIGGVEMENTRKYPLTKGVKLNKGKYIVECVLSSGGSGITYKAKSQAGIYYCIKECYPIKLDNNIQRNITIFVDSLEFNKETAQAIYAKYVEFFQNETQRVLDISKNLDNNNDYSILQLIDSFEEKGFFYNVYQTASSDTLWDEFSKDTETLSTSRVKWYVDIFIKLLKSLKTLHEEKKILHLDISPDNVLVMSEEQETVRIIDYGSSIKLNEPTPLDFIYSSKDGYSAFELCEYSIGNTKYVENLTPATDIYSVGACMFRCFVGRTIECSDYILSSWKDELRKNCNVSYDISDELIKIIEKSINNHMTERYPCANDMLMELQIVSDKTTSSRFIAPLKAYIKKTKRRFYTFAACASVLILLILYVTCYGISSVKMNNQIENAITKSNSNIYEALQTLVQIENQQHKFPFVRNEKVYEAISDVIDYAPGECLRQEKLFEKFDFLDIINADYIGVRADSKVFLVNVNTFRIDYEISPGNIIYTKDEIQYQPPFSSKIRNGIIKRVDIDNAVVYIYISDGEYEEAFVLDTNDEKPVVKQLDYYSTTSENTTNISEHTVYSDDNEYFVTYTDSPRVISVTNFKGETIELAHNVKVEKFGFRKDSRSLWTIDATGTLYLWSLTQDTYSYFDIIYDLNNKDMSWVVSDENTMYKLNNGSMTTIIEKSVSFIGQTKECIYLSVKDEAFEYPILCCYNKHSDIIKQIDKLPLNNSFEPHIMPINTLVVDKNIEYVDMAKETLNYISGCSLPLYKSEALENNNSIKVDYSVAESMLPNVSILSENEMMFTANELIKVSGSNISIIPLHPDGVRKIAYFFDENVEGQLTTDYDSPHEIFPIIIPSEYQDEQVHTMHIKLTTTKEVTSDLFLRFITHPRDNTPIVPRIEIQRGGKYMNEFNINSNKDDVIEMNISASQDIVVKCAFDNDARIYRYSGGKNTIAIPKDYLDGKQHTFLVQCSTEDNSSIWYEYPFIYK